MLHGFQLDPHTILGVTPGASLPEIREAYRSKTKKYHPDHGGDEWAFRVIVRAYELLNTTPAEVRQSTPPSAASPSRPAASATDRIRPGVQDRVGDLDRLVDVEILWFRFEMADLFELVNSEAEDTNLSGSINMMWPSMSQVGMPRDPGKEAAILEQLDEVVDEMRIKTRVVSSRCQREGGRMTAWLSYPSGDRAWKAFQTLHQALNARGLGVRQWTRDLIVPKQ